MSPRLGGGGAFIVQSQLLNQEVYLKATLSRRHPSIVESVREHGPELGRCSKAVWTPSGHGVHWKPYLFKRMLFRAGFPPLWCKIALVDEAVQE